MQTEVSENSVAKLTPAMPAEVKLQAYPDQVYKGRLRQIFPSADRAKAIVEVRVTILERRRAREAGDDRERHVPGAARGDAATDGAARSRPPASQPPPIVLDPEARGDGAERRSRSSGSCSRRRRRAAPVTLGAERLDQVEVQQRRRAGRGGDPQSAGRRSPTAALVRVKGT